MDLEHNLYFREYKPTIQLQPYLRCYFHIRLEKQTSFSFPSDGCPGLIVNFSQPLMFRAGSFLGVIKEGCSLFGYLSRQFHIESIGRTEVLAAKFRPGRLAAFVAHPGAELTDCCVELEDLWSNQGRDNTQAIMAAPSIAEAITALESTFLWRLNTTKTHDTTINRSLGVILSQSGMLRVEHLAQQTGISRRQFERRFNRVIGLSPKRLCRIARLRGVVGSLKASPTQSWVDLALAHGYSDQAHFIREWKYFMGSSPQAFLKNLQPFESTIIGF